MGITPHSTPSRGARSPSGWQAALILREGNAPLGVGPQPDFIGQDLDAVASQLIQLIERYAAASRSAG